MSITNQMIEKVIDTGDIYVDFQPIFSLNTKKVIGMEALSRGVYDGQVISPYFLFTYARENDCVLKLDRLCREKAMRAFSSQSSDAMLFINFETSVLNEVISGTGEILRTTEENNLRSSNVVIELNESQVKDNDNLMKFVDFYRSRGFLIALDNVGSGFETLNRIRLVNPDIIKIDRMIVTGIESNNYNQEVFKSIVNTAKQCGALTVAEGVETVDEVITCMLMGVDYFQGYYFSRPDKFNTLFSNDTRIMLEAAAQKLNISIKKNPAVVTMQIETYKRIIYDLVNRLSCSENDDYNSELVSYMNEHNELEAAFLINMDGDQITDTVMHPDQKILAGFRPAVPGDNHSIKNYFYAIKEQIEDPFISGWYISAATGMSCKTISSKFYNKKGEMIIVCVDLKKC